MNIESHSNIPNIKNKDTSDDLVALTSQIVSSYLQTNPLSKDEVPCFIEEIHHKLGQLARSNGHKRENPRPAIAIADSITPDHIICLEDGKPFKMLKKHLMSVYGMTPQEYRIKWRLPPDYPMVAPNYAAKRQELARKSGLGRKQRS